MHPRHWGGCRNFVPNPHCTKWGLAPISIYFEVVPCCASLDFHSLSLDSRGTFQLLETISGILIFVNYREECCVKISLISFTKGHLMWEML